MHHKHCLRIVAEGLLFRVEKSPQLGIMVEENPQKCENMKEVEENPPSHRNCNYFVSLRRRWYGSRVTYEFCSERINFINKVRCLFSGTEFSGPEIIFEDEKKRTRKDETKFTRLGPDAKQCCHVTQTIPKFKASCFKFLFSFH